MQVYSMSSVFVRFQDQDNNSISDMFRPIKSIVKDFIKERQDSNVCVEKPAQETLQRIKETLDDIVVEKFW